MLWVNINILTWHTWTMHVLEQCTYLLMCKLYVKIITFRNQENVFEWRDMSIHRLLIQEASTIKLQLSVYKAGIMIVIMFTKLASWSLSSHRNITCSRRHSYNCLRRVKQLMKSNMKNKEFFIEMMIQTKTNQTNIQIIAKEVWLKRW